MLLSMKSAADLNQLLQEEGSLFDGGTEWEGGGVEILPLPPSEAHTHDVIYSLGEACQLTLVVNIHAPH